MLPSGDPRYPLTQLLKRYEPWDDADNVQRERVLRFVETTEACAERSHLPGHLTGSAWVVDPSGSMVLLTHHRKLGRWLQLGGHADGELDLRAVALREAVEEGGVRTLTPVGTGVFDIDVHEIPERGEIPSHLHYDLRFAFRLRESESPQKSEESFAVAWVPIANLHTVTQESSLLRMADKWLKFYPAKDT